MRAFEDHELIFLGTGGGRIHCVTQHRKTGGFVYAFNGAQMHIDPGPGAMVYLNQMKIDRLKTKWLLVTHAHTDHNNDVPVVIESMHKTLKKPAGKLITTKEYLDELNDYYKGLLIDIIPMEAGKKVDLTNTTSIQGTKTIHGMVSGFGIIFEHKNPNNENEIYRLAYTSDTEIFNEYADQYKGVDILIANVLRPDDKHCDRHTAVDELIPELIKIKPKVLIMTHFGAMMDSEWAGGDHVSEQVQKIEKTVNYNIKIIGAQDGQKIKIRDII